MVNCWLREQPELNTASSKYNQNWVYYPGRSGLRLTGSRVNVDIADRIDYDRYLELNRLTKPTSS